MPWNQTDPMNQRTRLVLAYQDGLYTMTELCARFGVSRKTGYKWLHRYREQGLGGLKDHSRAPKRCPHQTDAEVAELLLATRRSHPRWGPRKLIAYLDRRYPEVAWPAASTVGALLKRHGLVEGKRRRHKAKHPGTVPLVTSAPNQVWGADFKGEFRMRNGQYCYPLTITEAHSRYLRACWALPSTRQAVCHAGALGALSSERLVDQTGHCPPTHRAWQTPAKRSSRADAPYAQGRDHTPA